MKTVRLLQALALSALVPGALPLAQTLPQQSAGRLPVERTFPMVPTETFGDLGIRFTPDPALVEELGEVTDPVTMRGVLVPTPHGFETLDLDLVRVDPIADDAVLQVNGEVVAGAEELREGISLWTGKVRGETSDVYLAFTPTGVRGWIGRESGRIHLFAVPGADEDWHDTTTLLVHEEDPMIAQVTPSWTCETDTSNPILDPSAFENPGRQGISGKQASSSSSGTVECKMHIDSDYQWYQLFNDLTAATNYATSLWGAVSCRFVDAIDVFITVSNLTIWTNSNDPWTTPDIGGSSSRMLSEFQNSFQGNPFPNGAHLAHFMSGANLGGGVAYLASLCTGAGVAVSGNMHGQTPMPVPLKSSLNWDCVVTAHETGHNFGSPHTHDYCPPIDSCYPGLCTTTTQCISNGTIMGYCHLCPGGLNNVQTLFHPRVAKQMMAIVGISCLCSICPCTGPIVFSVNPSSAVAYDPAGQTITVNGNRMLDVDTVYVDSTPVDPAKITVVSNTQVRFEMPTVPHAGTVDIVVADDCGTSSTSGFIQVDPPATPGLGMSYAGPFPYLSRNVGAPVTIGGLPGDLVYAFWSPDLSPTVYPGFVAFDIGNNFQTLYDLWFFTMPSKGWESMTFPISGLPLGSQFFVQAGILRGVGNFPLLMTGAALGVAWY